MALPTDLDEFRALSLILQHRALGRALDTIAATIESCQSSGATDYDTAARLLPILRSFTQALPEHFAAESRSTAPLLRDIENAEFERRLLELDGEHPHLLARFQHVVLQLTNHGTRAGDVCLLLPFQRIIQDLVTAVEAFRRHESEEDALFVD